MKLITTAIICIAVGFGGGYLLLGQSSPQAVTNADATEQQYTCGMHPQIISNEPGICPICNMKLTPIRSGHSGSDGVVIDPTTRQNIGLATAAATMTTIDRAVNAFGKIVVPDPNVYRVTLKTEGWVEKLFVNETGEQVFEGQPLLEIYSPDLITAQKEYLVALKSGSNPAMTRLAETARMRLINWDVSEDQLERLEDSGEVFRTIIVRAPASGFVRSKNVAEGDRIVTHSVLYEIDNLDNVWVEAQIYEVDLPFVSLGQTARLRVPSLPGEVFDGTVNYISPQLDDRGQVEVRMTLDNPDYKLKPEMYAEIAIVDSLEGERLTIPRSAIINSGLRQLVYVEGEDNSYEARTIRTGAIGSNDRIEVVDGLRPGSSVVVSGQFLIDSESRLSENASAGGHMHGAMGGMNEESDDDSDHADHAEHEGHAMENKDAMNHDHAMHTEKKADPFDIYTCPMPSHFHVLNFGPGECAECGMKLVPITETDNKPVYVCPMPQDSVVSKEPGLCPKCNMKLIEYKPKKPDLFNIHTCPMPSHFHVLNYGPGECPDCGMKLVPVTETENKPIYVCPMPEDKVASKEPGLCPKCNMKLVEYKPGESDD